MAVKELVKELVVDDLQLEELEVVEETGPRCPHFWVIETPSGPTSSGACRICGEGRSFMNYIESSYWEDDPTPAEVTGKQLGLVPSAERETE